MMKQHPNNEWYCNKCGETVFFNGRTAKFEHYLQGAQCSGADYPNRQPPEHVTILGEVIEVSDDPIKRLAETGALLTRDGWTYEI